MAEERLQGTGIRCFVTPGNDDYVEVDDALQGSEVVEYVEGRCVRLSDELEMVTTGYSNITPWRSPREMDEPELLSYIQGMFAEADDPAKVVAVLHPPPLGTELDQAPEIDEEFRVQMSGGSPKMTSVGSSAVREAIETYPATARPPRPRPRVEGGPVHRPHLVYQPRIRVHQRHAPVRDSRRRERQNRLPVHRRMT